MQIAVDIAVSLVPVLVFLLALVFLDSFKLVKSRVLVITIAWGIGTALMCYAINDRMLQSVTPDDFYYKRYGSPILEECFKSLLVFYLIASKRVGFMVDAAIYGFAVGTGFALAENLYYVQAIRDANIFVWIIRGFGTAIMHGGTTAILAIIAKSLSDQFASANLKAIVPGLLLAIAIHSLFNHFLLHPVVSTLLIMMILPSLMMFVFKRSEQKTRIWLGVNLDADMELLHLINSGNLSDSKMGQYLFSLKSRFPAEVIMDMLCLLRIHTELSIKSKGVIMMREVGFQSSEDPEIKEKFAEMKYLERSIGKTGKLAILPFLHTSSQSLWQIHMLEK